MSSSSSPETNLNAFLFIESSFIELLLQTSSTCSSCCESWVELCVCVCVCVATFWPRQTEREVERASVSRDSRDTPTCVNLVTWCCEPYYIYIYVYYWPWSRKHNTNISRVCLFCIWNEIEREREKKRQLDRPIEREREVEQMRSQCLKLDDFAIQWLILMPHFHVLMPATFFSIFLVVVGISNWHQYVI